MRKYLFSFFISILFYLIFNLPAYSMENISNNQKNNSFKISGFVDSVIRFPTNKKKENISGSDYSFDIYKAGLKIDCNYGIIGFTGEYRISTTGTYDLNKHWLENAYVFLNLPINLGKIELGKIYNPFGLDDDNVWYKSHIYYMGFMQDSDWGLKYSLDLNFGNIIKLGLSGSYMLISDGYNGGKYSSFGLEANGFKEKDTFIGRIYFNLTIPETIDLNIGLSGMLGACQSPANWYFRQNAGEVDLSIKFLFFNIISEFILFDQDAAGTFSTTEASRAGYIFMAGITLNPFDNLFKNYKSDLIKSIEIAYNFSCLIPRTSAAVPFYRQNYLHSIDLRVIHNNNFISTLEYTFGTNELNSVFEDSINFDFTFKF